MPSDSRNAALHFWMDTHVHLYSTFKLDSALDSAMANFIRHSQGAQGLGKHAYALFLTDGVGENSVQTVKQACDKEDLHWKISQHGNNFIAQHRDKPQHEIIIVACQQLVSTEGLEVLVIGGHRQDYVPKKPVRDLLQDNQDHTVILPWGFGKWLGNRGQLVLQLLNDANYKNAFFLGDIPARLNILGGHDQFKLSQQQHRPILRGVDPLPLQGEQARIAEFGSCLSINSQQPLTADGSTLISYLKVAALQHASDSNQAVNATTDITHFGPSLNLVKNLATQIKLRLNK